MDAQQRELVEERLECLLTLLDRRIKITVATFEDMILVLDTQSDAVAASYDIFEQVHQALHSLMALCPGTAGLKTHVYRCFDTMLKLGLPTELFSQLFEIGADRSNLGVFDIDRVEMLEMSMMSQMMAVYAWPLIRPVLEMDLAPRPQIGRHVAVNLHTAARAYVNRFSTRWQLECRMKEFYVWEHFSNSLAAILPLYPWVKEWQERYNNQSLTAMNRLAEALDLLSRYKE